MANFRSAGCPVPLLPGETTAGGAVQEAFLDLAAPGFSRAPSSGLVAVPFEDINDGPLRARHCMPEQIAGCCARTRPAACPRLHRQPTGFPTSIHRRFVRNPQIVAEQRVMDVVILRGSWAPTMLGAKATDVGRRAPG